MLEIHSVTVTAAFSGGMERGSDYVGERDFSPASTDEARYMVVKAYRTYSGTKGQSGGESRNGSDLTTMSRGEQRTLKSKSATPWSGSDPNRRP